MTASHGGTSFLAIALSSPRWRSGLVGHQGNVMPRACVIAFIICTPHLAFAQAPTVLKHDGWVAAVAFAPDGKTLASAGADNVVRLWEVGTWKPKGVLKGHTDCVIAISFSQTKDRLATASYDGTANLYEVSTGANLISLRGHRGAITSIATVDDIVFTGGVDGLVNFNLIFESMVIKGIYDSMQLPGMKHRSWVNSIVLAPGNGKRRGIAAASGSSDGTVEVFGTGGIALGLPIATREGGAGEVRCIAYSPNGKLLAAGNRFHTVRVWETTSLKEIKTLTGLMSDVWSIAFSPDGKTLAAVDTDWKKPSKIKLYDTNTWKERGSLPTPGEILSIAYSPKGDWLAAGCWDKTVRVFPIAIDKK